MTFPPHAGRQVRGDPPAAAPGAAKVVEDVGKSRKLDPKHLVTLAWSSSGTLAYTLAALWPAAGRGTQGFAYRAAMAETVGR